MSWKALILSLFPEIFPGPLTHSITGNAIKSKLCSITAYNIRDSAIGKHKTVDDKPYGGGVGMIMRPDIISIAIEKHFILNNAMMPIIHLSPRGKVLDQETVIELSKLDGIQIICSRFEGIDERILEEYKIIEISLGDFILSCGDIAALVLLDACIRLLPGAIKNSNALNEESFTTGGSTLSNLLEYPQYTKPAVWNNRTVPEVLLSGHHKEIAKWRVNKAREITKEKRPDLWLKYKS